MGITYTVYVYYGLVLDEQAIKQLYTKGFLSTPHLEDEEDLDEVVERLNEEFFGCSYDRERKFEFHGQIGITKRELLLGIFIVCVDAGENETDTLSLIDLMQIKGLYEYQASALLRQSDLLLPIDQAKLVFSGCVY